jgi:hypothetical protein
MQTNRFAFVVMILFSTLTSSGQEQKNWFTSQTSKANTFIAQATCFNPKRAIQSWTLPCQTPRFTLLGSVTTFSIINILDKNITRILQHIAQTIKKLPQKEMRSILRSLQPAAKAFCSPSKIRYTLYAATTFGIISTLYYGSELGFIHWFTSLFCQNRTTDIDAGQEITRALQQAQAELCKAKKTTHKNKQAAKEHLLKAYQEIENARLTEEAREKYT